MKFFVDSGEINEISKLAETGMLDGVTTNPSLVATSGKDFVSLVREITQMVKGHVSAEVLATDTATMLKEADILRSIADNVCIKVPLTVDGLKACKALAADGTAVNVTLCFSAVQALLAAKAGATYISPFVGRLDDVGESGMQLVRDIILLYDNYPEFKTQILAASIRSPIHVLEAALAGADVATVPPKILWQLYNHPLTDKGLTAFQKDWEKTGQKLI